MDFLRSQFAIVQDRLAGLTASQRMLAGALVVILVMTMLYWGKVSGSADRVALLATPLPTEELTQLTTALKAKGINVTVDGGKVMVPANQALDAMGEVSYAGLVPEGTTNALDAMLEKVTPWSTSSQFDARMVSARQQYIAQILKKWPGVRSADVYINEAKKLALTQREPSLTVNIQSKSSASINRKQLAKSARDFVQRCMSGLRPENIAIAIDGATMVVGAENDIGMSSDLLDIQVSQEAMWLAKLQNQLSYIDGVLISVAVEVENATVIQRQHTVDPKNKISEMEQSETETQKPVGPAAPQQEPGVMANIAIDVGQAAPVAGASGIEIEKNKIQNKVDFGTTDTTTNRSAGKPTITGTSVSVPRSFLKKVWRNQSRSTDPQAEPSEAELQPIIANITKNVRDTVFAVTGIKEESRITVGAIWDLEPIVGGPVLAAATPGLGGNLGSMATSHAKEIVLGILAVASLFMVSRMVKKSEPLTLNLPALAGAGGPALAGVGGDGGIATVGDTTTSKRKVSNTVGGEDIAGEVGGEGGEAVMIGQELDPDVLETSQIIEQVSSFVKQNPDAAAQMVSRWMSRD